MATLGERLIDWLEAYEVDTVFGIPGVHTVELYRGLADSTIHHVTPRHEQGAGFMADGYARATGKPGVAFVITGPGLTNILTPMAQAYADSIPMLVISSVNRTQVGGMGGDLHEVRNQGLIAAQAAAFSHTITHPDQLPEVLARAFAVFEDARPRPVHIQIPLDLLSGPAPVQDVAVRTRSRRVSQGVGSEQIQEVANGLSEAERPLILCGGGMVNGGEALAEIARLLDAPVVQTVNARGLLPADHPLLVPASPSLETVRAAIAEADAVLAIGTEFGRTDYDMYDRGGFSVPGRCYRIEIDPVQGAGPALDGWLLPGDGPTITRDLCVALAAREARAPRAGSSGSARAARLRAAAWDEIGARYQSVVRFLDTIQTAIPDAPIVCDSTQAAYAGNLYFAANAPRRWFNASTGYGALGYGLPAAIGAARGLASFSRPVVCIAGDGGVQFTLADLGTAIEERLPVILLVWNNRGYGEIKDFMIERQITPVGVDLHTPDFVGIAKAYGAVGMGLESIDDLPALLREAAVREEPTVIEIDEALVLG